MLEEAGVPKKNPRIQLYVSEDTLLHTTNIDRVVQTCVAAVRSKCIVH